jgi:hypothetical protein
MHLFNQIRAVYNYLIDQFHPGGLLIEVIQT